MKITIESINIEMQWRQCKSVSTGAPLKHPRRIKHPYMLIDVVLGVNVLLPLGATYESNDGHRYTVTSTDILNRTSRLRNNFYKTTGPNYTKPVDLQRVEVINHPLLSKEYVFKL